MQNKEYCVPTWSFGKDSSELRGGEKETGDRLVTAVCPTNKFCSARSQGSEWLIVLRVIIISMECEMPSQSPLSNSHAS